MGKAKSKNKDDAKPKTKGVKATTKSVHTTTKSDVKPKAKDGATKIKGGATTPRGAAKKASGTAARVGAPKSAVGVQKATRGAAGDTPAPTSESAATPGVFSAALRVGDGFDLTECDPRSTPAFEGRKAAGEKLLASTAQEISQLQERLYAQARGGARDRLLLVVQGMDTSGKGGIMRHVVGLMDPQGVDITAFKAPTREEREHPFLWRIRPHLPTPGQVGVFDRSHYEDVLIGRVRSLASPSTINRRYGQINAFERTFTRDGGTVVKVMLHISKQEQGARLAERLERPEKHWKFNPGDIDERALWDDYQAAYQAVLDKTSSEHAPWHVVPADRKWYARLAVQQLVLEHLLRLDPQWPTADFDVDEQRRRLSES